MSWDSTAKGVVTLRNQFNAPVTLLHYQDPVSHDDARKVLGDSSAVTLHGAVENLAPYPIVITTDKILNAILPPRVVTMADGSTKLQFVEAKQITRPQLQKLQTTFEEQLRESKARETGICHVRSAIYQMLFDELIREIAIDNPERGLLLLRIRDELRMTVSAYKTLNEASLQFGKKRATEGDRGMHEMTEKIATLTAKREVLRKEVTCLESKRQALDRCCKEQQQADEKRYHEERVFLERTKQRLEAQLEAIKQIQEAERRALRGEM